MSILSTSAKLVKVGQDYSAGNGISIDNYVISVTAAITGEYASQSAFDELNDSFSALSSNLNSNSGIWVDVANTYQTNSSTYLTAHQSLNGYATEQWVEDKGYITGVDLTPYQEKSGMVDYQTTAGMTAYATTSDVANKLDTTAFSNVSGTFLTAHQTIPSAKWETASDVVQSNSAQWSENTGDEEVNNAVYNNSAKWNEISVYESNSSTYLTAHQSLDGYATQDWVTGQGYITGVDLSDYAKTSAVYNDIDSAVSGKLDTTAFSDVSGNFLTAHQDISYKLDTTAFSDVSGTFLTAVPADMATTGDVADLAQTISETYQVKGDYLTTADSANFYPANNPSGFITGVDLTNYYTKSETSGADELASAFANIPAGDAEVNAYVQSNSSTIDDVNTSYQTNSGNFLTAINIPESADWNNVASTYQTNSSTYLTAHQSLDGYATTSELNSTSSYLSGAIDYVSANAGSNVSSYPYIVSSKSLSGPASAFIPNPVINFSGAGSWPGLTRYPVKITLSSDGQEKECGWLAPASTASQIGNSNIFLGWSTNWKSPGWQTLDVYQKNETSGADELASAFANASSTLPSAFEVDEDGQAYKVSAYTSAINPTSTAFDSGITEFPINEIGAYVYTTNISNGRWQLDGGTGGDIVDNTIDLTDIPESTWEYSTKLQVQDYSWPPQEATLSTTAEIVERTPYLLSGQGGGVPQSAFDELKSSYDALSSLFATYSGQWLLPNTGV